MPKPKRAQPDYGEKLRRLRKHLRLTQTQMAEILDVNRSNYKNWEYGQSQPPLTVKEKVRLIEARSGLGIAQLSYRYLSDAWSAERPDLGEHHMSNLLRLGISPKDRKAWDSLLGAMPKNGYRFMEATGSELREWRTTIAHMTQAEVARHLGMTRGGYANYESGVKIPDDKLLVLKQLGFNSDAHALTAAPTALEIPVPYIGAIAPNLTVYWSNPCEADDFHFVPMEMGEPHGRFCCRIADDSMYDFLWPDDVCVFQESNIPKIGTIVMHQSPNGQLSVKLLAHDGSSFKLQTINSIYGVADADGTVVGHLVGLIRSVGSTKITVLDPNGIRPSLRPPKT